MMQFYDSLDRVPADFGPSAVTFGKFDGVHTGHRRVIESLRSVARVRGLTSTVLTFDRNPLSLLDPDRCPENIVTNRQKRELVEAAGVDAMVQLPFDRTFSALSANDFVARVLAGVLRARVVLVGPDTRFGSGGTGGFAQLTELGRKLGFEVPHLDLHRDGDLPVSSTRIRQLLAEGSVAEAARLLGRRPAVRSIVVRGQQRGRTLGYPTANLSPDLEGFIPADGVYAGLLKVDGRSLPAAISIGNNPTFQGVPEKQVEAHVLDQEIDLYDRIVEVEFVDYIRGMEKFDSLAELIAQMGRDTAQAREILNRVIA
ncbi:MAG: Riboflavin biosynthesis protein [Microbacteriaceae bacterium]|jgi:riboflavin kinase/FMN adenylyltransferase|nr:Riboflavin biosynthesis protein [Microbacteriaceae bacterium]HEV7955946.1 bifunctional riboflavin kinase/FAD synthetase [Marisediminicola sp.]